MQEFFNQIKMTFHSEIMSQGTGTIISIVSIIILLAICYFVPTHKEKSRQ